MSTIDSVLAWASDLAPENIAVQEWESGRTIDFRTLDNWASALANFFASVGLRAGDRVGLHLPNKAEFLVAQFGSIRAGGVASYVNFRLQPEEAARQFKLAEVRSVVTTSERAAIFREDRDLADMIIVVADGGQPLGHSLAEILSAAPSRRAVAPANLADADAIARFTSGSTGLPKGVLVSNRAWLIRAVSLLAEEIKAEPGSTTMVLGPLSHQAGLFVLPTFMRTGSMLLFERFTVEKATAALEQRRIETVQMVPTLLKMFMTEQKARAAIAAAGVKRLVYGGSPIEPQVIEDCLDVLSDCDVIQSYGSHEAGSISHLDGPGHRSPELRKSAGRPFLAAEVRVARREDSDIGEIEVRAPWTPRARITEKGKEPVNEEWVPTGDLGEIRDGYVYLKDRANDVIISGGFNVYPMEIEGVLNTHPGILTSAVVSAPDPKWGERVIAFVVPRDASVMEGDILKAHCKNRLAGFKVPKEFLAVSEVPTNPNGKPDRRKLSAPLWSGRDRRIS
jgi:acyl-CoA synthetase (AMP-forming)/AMP-acid ligase II